MLRPVPVVKLPPRSAIKVSGEFGRSILVNIDALLIDSRYQRSFQPRNEARVSALASDFRRARFTPIIVADVGAGKYAVLDGQHRAAAALACGLQSIPAWLVDADESEQAATFIALNTANTKVDAMSVWHARLAADDNEARALFAICKSAGVEIARYPIPHNLRKPNVTLCPTLIREHQKILGDVLIVRALKILRIIGDETHQSLITRPFVRAVSALVRGDWRSGAIDDIARSLRGTNFSASVAKAVAKAKEAGGTSTEHLVRTLREQAAGRRVA